MFLKKSDTATKKKEWKEVRMEDAGREQSGERRHGLQKAVLGCRRRNDCTAVSTALRPASHQASQPGHRFFIFLIFFNLFKTVKNNNGPKVMQIVRASLLFLKKRFEIEHITAHKMMRFLRTSLVFHGFCMSAKPQKQRMPLGTPSFSKVSCAHFRIVFSTKSEDALTICITFGPLLF